MNNLMIKLDRCLKRCSGRPWRLSATLGLVLLVSACSNSDPSVVFEATGANAQSVELSPPRFLTDRNINQDLVSPIVTVNGVRASLTRVNASPSFRGVVQVPEGEDVQLTVNWFERFNNRDLLLSTLVRNFPSVNSNVSISFVEDDYQSRDASVAGLDEDFDSISNLVERLEGSDPFSRADPGNTRADTFLIPIEPEQGARIVIDGSFDAIWGDAQYNDNAREPLAINNRMIGFDPNRADQNTEFRWGGMHDGRYLYLFVLGENSRDNNRTTQGDSILPWMDDAIDIFIDGNRSQGSLYDGFDDYHLIIPLVKLNTLIANRSHMSGVPSNPEFNVLDPEGRGETGTNSVTIDNFEGVRFATCVCPENDTYEIRLDLEALNIPIDRSFGFDIQINNDVDGGEREFKFGWQAPSAGEGVFEFDETWRNPSLMGLAQLVPLPAEALATVPSQ